MRTPLACLLALCACRTVSDLPPTAPAAIVDSLRTPVSDAPGHAPPPPPNPNTTAWDPEPPTVTAALGLRAAEPERALEALLAAAADARTAKDGRTEAIALHRAGDVSLDLDECEAAEGLYLRALLLHQGRGDLGLVATAANDLGLMCGACDRDPVKWFQQALELRERLGEPRALRLATANLGGALMLWRTPAEARPVLERALSLAVELGDLEAQRKTHVNLASCLALEADQAHAPPLQPGKPGLRAEAVAHIVQARHLAVQLGLDPARTCSALVLGTHSLCDGLEE